MCTNLSLFDFNVLDFNVLMYISQGEKNPGLEMFTARRAVGGIIVCVLLVC